MICPKCDRQSAPKATECECGVIFARLKRQAKTEQPAGPALCSWNDQGISCPARGILSSTTGGGGPWYCREHAYRIEGRDVPLATDGKPIRGNAAPERHHSLGAIRWHREKQRSIDNARPANGYVMPAWARERQPGDDDA